MSGSPPPSFSLRIKHPFYADEVCRDFTLLPSERTLRCLQGARWVFKSQPDGFLIAGSKTSQVEIDEPPLFFMLLRNPRFAYFTGQMPTDDSPGRALVLFSPKKGKGQDFAVAPARVFRDPEMPDKAAVIRSCARNPETIGSPGDAVEAMALGNLFGVIQMPSTKLSVSSPPAKIQFQRLEVSWVYRIEGSGAQIPKKLTILDHENGGISNDRAFTPVPSVCDVYPRSISFHREESGGTTTFTSESPLPCFELPRRNLVLCKDGEEPRALLHLPNPSLTSLTPPAAPGEMATLTHVINAAALSSLS